MKVFHDNLRTSQYQIKPILGKVETNKCTGGFVRFGSQMNHSEWIPVDSTKAINCFNLFTDASKLFASVKNGLYEPTCKCGKYDLDTYIVQLPLKTRGTKIVDQRNAEIRLACVNLQSHDYKYVPNGLQYNNLEMLVKRIHDFGFNCVRFAISSEMFTDTILHSKPNETFLGDNDELKNSTVKEVFLKTCVMLAKYNIMIILDMHV